jgi:hypothetical protein
MGVLNTDNAFERSALTILAAMGGVLAITFTAFGVIGTRVIGAGFTVAVSTSAATFITGNVVAPDAPALGALVKRGDVGDNGCGHRTLSYLSGFHVVTCSSHKQSLAMMVPSPPFSLTRKKPHSMSVGARMRLKVRDHGRSRSRFSVSAQESFGAHPAFML